MKRGRPILGIASIVVATFLVGCSSGQPTNSTKATTNAGNNTASEKADSTTSGSNPTESTSLQREIFSKTNDAISTIYLPTFMPKGETVVNVAFNRNTDLLSMSFNNITIMEGTKSNLKKEISDLVPEKMFYISNGMPAQWLHNNSTNAILVQIGQSPTQVLISSKNFDKEMLLKVASSLKMYNRESK